MPFYEQMLEPVKKVMNPYEELYIIFTEIRSETEKLIKEIDESQRQVAQVSSINMEPSS